MKVFGQGPVLVEILVLVPVTLPLVSCNVVFPTQFKVGGAANFLGFVHALRVQSTVTRSSPR